MTYPMPIPVISDADANSIADSVTKIGATLVARPQIRAAAATVPVLIGRAIGGLRTQSDPLPGNQLTESPKRYASRPAGTIPYFDGYNKRRPVSLSDGILIPSATAVPSGAGPQTITFTVNDPRGTPVEGVEVRFVVLKEKSAIDAAAAITDGKGEVTVEWTFEAMGEHVLQAVAGPCFVAVKTT